MKQKKQVQISLAVSIRIRYLFQVRGEELLKMFPKYSCKSIYCHTAKVFDLVEGDMQKLNPG